MKIASQEQIFTIGAPCEFNTVYLTSVAVDRYLPLGIDPDIAYQRAGF